MRYISLNHNSQPVDFKTAVMNGLAPDKGLYFPEEIISLPKKITDNIKSINDHELCYEVIKEYIGEYFTKDELIQIIEKTIDFKIPLNKREVFVVPEGAIIQDDDKTYIYKVFNNISKKF